MVHPQEAARLVIGYMAAISIAGFIFPFRGASRLFTFWWIFAGGSILGLFVVGLLCAIGLIH